MRIGIEAQRIARSKKHGMDLFAIELIRNLIEIDKTNFYFIFYAPGDDFPSFKRQRNFRFIRIKSHIYPLWEQIFLPQKVRKTKCDILHCTSNTAPLKITCPLVVSLHDIIYLEKRINTANPNLYQLLGDKYRRTLIPKLLRKQQTFITVSKSESSIIKEKTGIDSKFIYNSCPDYFTNNISTQKLNKIRLKYKLPLNYIFFIGNTNPKKNCINVLKAFSLLIESLRNTIHLVISDLSINNLKSLLKKIEKKELINHIHLIDYVSNKDLPAIYAQSKLFLYPSLRESFGMPIIEAFKSGTPVITSINTAMEEIADNAAILVDPQKPESIYEGIQKLLDNKDLSSQLVDAGKIRSNKFSGQSMAKEYLKVYNEVFINR